MIRWDWKLKKNKNNNNNSKINLNQTNKFLGVFEEFKRRQEGDNLRVENMRL